MKQLVSAIFLIIALSLSGCLLLSSYQDYELVTDHEDLNNFILVSAFCDNEDDFKILFEEALIVYDIDRYVELMSQKDFKCIDIRNFINPIHAKLITLRKYNIDIKDKNGINYNALYVGYLDYINPDGSVQKLISWRYEKSINELEPVGLDI